MFLYAGQYVICLDCLMIVNINQFPSQFTRFILTFYIIYTSIIFLLRAYGTIRKIFDTDLIGMVWIDVESLKNQKIWYIKKIESNNLIHMYHVLYIHIIIH